MKKKREHGIRKIIKFIRKFRLQKRFLLLVIFSVVIPLLVLEIITFHSVRNVFQKRNYETMQQEIDSYNSLVNNRLQEYSSIGNRIATSIYTIKMMEKTATNQQLQDFVEANEYDKKLDAWTGDLEDYFAIEVISSKGMFISKPYRFIENDITLSKLYSAIMEQDKRQVWIGAHNWENNDRYLPPPAGDEYQYPLVISTKIKGAYSSDYLGCINLYLKRSIMLGLISEVLNYREKSSSYFSLNDMYIIDPEGTIIAHTDIEKIGTPIDPEIFDALNKDIIHTPDERLVRLNQGKARKLVFASESKLTGMTIIALVDYDEFYQVINQIFRIILISSLFVLYIMGAISWIYFNSIRTPIDQIVWGMKQIEKNNFSVVVDDDGKDELSDLTERFNRMVKKTNALIDQKISIEREKKEAELQVLEEQINPHFLYNTLDMINWIAYEKSDEQICHIIEALSDFYRLGLNSGERVYTIDQEIKHVSAYIEIQKARFQGKIEYHFDVPEYLYPYNMIKIVLQPLVENAIVHGIIPKDSPGNIWISARKENGLIVFKIMDDGVGFHDMKKKSSGSYGLQNVDERIKMYFGNHYGLSVYERKDMSGVISEIRIPAIMGGKADENFISR